MALTYTNVVILNNVIPNSFRDLQPISASSQEQFEDPKLSSGMTGDKMAFRNLKYNRFKKLRLEFEQGLPPNTLL